MSDWERVVENLRRLLRELPSGPTDSPGISSFEALEQEISTTVEELHVERLKKTIRSLAGRARTPESLEKIASDVQENFRDVINKKLAEIDKKRFSSLTDRAGDCVLTADAHTGRILDVNQTAVHLLGYTREQLLRLHIQDIEEALSRSPSETWKTWLAEIKTSGEATHIEGVLRRNDEVSFPVEFSVTLRTFENQDYLVIFARDITARKQAENQLRDRCRFFHQLLDGFADGILAFDLDRAVTFCNPALERFLGINKEEVIGKNLLEELPCFKELGEDRFVLEALAGKTVTSRNRPYRIPVSNRNVFFDACYSPLSGVSKEVLGGVVVLRNVTDPREIEQALQEAREALEMRTSEHTASRKQMQQQVAREVADLRGAENALQQSEDKFRRLVENLTENIITVNRNGKFTFLNHPWPGTAEEQLVAADFYQFIGSESHDSFRNCLERVFQTAEVERLEITTLNGKRYENCVVPLIRDQSVVAGMIIATEITPGVEERDRRKDQASIQHSQEMENSAMLASGVAQGYGELLTNLLGHVGSVLEDIPPDSPARYSLEQIEASALRASDLTHLLRAYSGEITPGHQTLHLGHLVDEMKESLERLVSPMASLEIQISAHTPPIKSDAGQIRQLILNLVKNASEALREQKGLITLSTGVMEADRVYLSESLLGEKLPEGSYVYIEVTDTGEGMGEETLARFYVPFFTTKPGSNGLGLATVIGTVLGHGGAIRVTSFPERGTAVRVVFPQLEPPGEPDVED